MSNTMLVCVAPRLHVAQCRMRAFLTFRDQAGARAVIVLGTGRSGTIRLAEQLAHAMCWRIVFEPLHPAASPGCNWMGSRTYLRKGDPDLDWRELLDAVVSGTLRHRWTDRSNPRFVYCARLVKMIRGNRMLGWLARSYVAVDRWSSNVL